MVNSCAKYIKLITLKSSHMYSVEVSIEYETQLGYAMYLSGSN